MSGVQGPTPEVMQMQMRKKGKAQQMVSRDDLINAIKQLQLPGHTPSSQQQQGQPQVLGENG